MECTRERINVKKPPIDIIIQLTAREADYFRITAFNRFCDNVERALKGDVECRDNLLAEDINDAREYWGSVFRKIQNEL
jgi:hypothetical protein